MGAVEGVPEPAEDLRADPGAEVLQLLSRRAHRLVEAQVVGEADEAPVLGARRVQGHLVVAREAAPGIVELQATVGLVAVVRDAELQRLGHSGTALAWLMGPTPAPLPAGAKVGIAYGRRIPAQCLGASGEEPRPGPG
jgi:hypothetical protein